MEYVIHVTESQSFYVHHIYTKDPPPFPSFPHPRGIFVVPFLIA